MPRRDAGDGEPPVPAQRHRGLHGDGADTAGRRRRLRGSGDDTGHRDGPAPGGAGRPSCSPAPDTGGSAPGGPGGGSRGLLPSSGAGQERGAGQRPRAGSAARRAPAGPRGRVEAGAEMVPGARHPRVHPPGGAGDGGAGLRGGGRARPGDIGLQGCRWLLLRARHRRRAVRVGSRGDPARRLRARAEEPSGGAGGASAGPSPGRAVPPPAQRRPGRAHDPRDRAGGGAALRTEHRAVGRAQARDL